MAWLHGTMLLYGILNLTLGVIAFTRDSSNRTSLIAGGTIGLIVIAAAALAKTKPTAGYALAAVMAVMMLIRFGPIMFQPEKATHWVAVILAPASVAMLLALIVGHFTARR